MTPEFWGQFWLQASIISIILIGGLILLLNRYVDNNNVFNIILILYALFLISIAANGFKSGGFAVLGIPISFIVFFLICKKYEFEESNLKITFWLFFVWSILPVILLVLPGIRLTFFTAPAGNLTTFSGFALHRNFYGFITGITLILLYLKKWSVTYKIISIIIILFGIYLASCRTLLVALVLTFGGIIYYHNKISAKVKFILFCAVFSCVGITYLIMSDPEYSLREVDNNDDREELYSGFVDIIMEKPIIGHGENVIYKSQLFRDGAPAHNFILQTSANYGIPAMLLWCILLVVVYRKSFVFTKLMLIYLLMWGISQPYWGFGVFSAHIIVALFIARLLDCNLPSISSKF